MSQNDTVAAIATPPGAGGIAVVRLSGPQSLQIAARVFTPAGKGRQLQAMPGYTAAYGAFHSGDAAIDDGIVLVFHAPHSYTGEDVAELSCHGGPVVSRSLLEACIKAGAVPAGPGEFTRRAVLNGRLSLTQAEAVMELISAGSRAGARAALAAQHGVLHTKISDMKRELVELAGHLAAWTDYPEEDVEALEEGRFKTVATGVHTALQQLVDGYHRGSLVRRGVRTAIVGSPNVGKSTLFNLMSGFERAIVTPVAGTTRDVLREQIQMGGLTLLLADTAGLHQTEDLVEKEGIQRTKQEIEESELVLAVFDGSQPLTPRELDFAAGCSGRPALAIVNKSDLGMALGQDEINQLKSYFIQLIIVSARAPATLEAIEKAVERILELQDFDPDAAMLANSRQLAAALEARDALAAALEALAAGLGFDAAGVCLDDAIRALARLTGEDATESIINEVFSKFCVGK